MNNDDLIICAAIISLLALGCFSLMMIAELRGELNNAYYKIDKLTKGSA